MLKMKEVVEFGSFEKFDEEKYEVFLKEFNNCYMIYVKEGEDVYYLIDVDRNNNEEDFREKMKDELGEEKWLIWMDLVSEGDKIREDDCDWMDGCGIDYKRLDDYVEEVEEFIEKNMM